MNKKKIAIQPKKLSVSASDLTYEKDFFKWTKEQAQLLKNGELDNLDITHLIEEILSLGRSDKRALNSHLKNLLLHLLKLKCQPEMSQNSNSWLASTRNARYEIHLILKDSPSLKKLVKGMIDDVYELARLDAISETGLSPNKFPNECPWNQEEILG